MGQETPFVRKTMFRIVLTTLLLAWIAWGAFVFYFPEYFSFKLTAFLFLVGLSVVAYQVRDGFSKKSKRMYSREQLYLAIQFVLIFFATCLLHNLNKRQHWGVDATHQKLYQVKSSTNEIVSELTKQGTLKLTFWGTREHWRQYEDLLLFYKSNSSKLSLEWINPDKNPEKAKNIQGRTLPLLLAEFQDKRQWIDPIDEWTMGLAFKGFMKTHHKMLCFLNTHQTVDIQSKEVDGYSEFKDFLQSEGYKIQNFNLDSDTDFSHCDLAIIAGAKDDFLGAEIQHLKSLSQKIPLVVAMDPWAKDVVLKNLRNWLKTFGLESFGTPVMDQTVVELGEEPINVLWESTNHTHDVAWQRLNEVRGRTLWQLTTAFSVAKNLPTKTESKIVPLVWTQAFPGTWQEKDWSEITSGKVVFKENDDLKGPLLLALQIQGSEKENIVVLGTSRVWMNGFAGYSANFSFGRAVMMTLLKDNNVNMPIVTLKEEKLLLHRDQANLIFYFSIIIVPLLMLFFAYLIFKKNNQV